MGNGTLHHCLRERRKPADREVFAKVMARISESHSKRAEKAERSIEVGKKSA
ncbi:MAG: hypothetical protein GX141_10885 [Armatimonadetes bacterium]|jgi:hypothetical protein|nr:hypothetical protein [Armatimonadota bacterium]